ncbi:hypothetical protein BHM03_00058189 [Ensete ventricosum]|nr:hypothetical protein BHM03_00058189 [Ensete ventricosum]
MSLVPLLLIVEGVGEVEEARKRSMERLGRLQQMARRRDPRSLNLSAASTREGTQRRRRRPDDGGEAEDPTAEMIATEGRRIVATEIGRQQKVYSEKGSTPLLEECDVKRCCVLTGRGLSQQKVHRGRGRKASGSCCR